MELKYCLLPLTHGNNNNYYNNNNNNNNNNNVYNNSNNHYNINNNMTLTLVCHTTISISQPQKYLFTRKYQQKIYLKQTLL